LIFLFSILGKISPLIWVCVSLCPSIQLGNETLFFSLLFFFKYYFRRRTKRTSYGWGCKTKAGTIAFCWRSSNDFPSGSEIVVCCINVDRNRNMRDFANTSPIQLLFPVPKGRNLKIQNSCVSYMNWIYIVCWKQY
jgi:hypothetical protein